MARRGARALPAVLLAIAGLLTAAPAAAAGLDRRGLRVGLEPDEPPFSSLGDDGRFAGFDADVARAACLELQAACELVPGSAAEFAQLLQGRTVDLVLSIAITEARRRTVDFTEPYYEAPSRFVVPRARPSDVSPKGLEGRTVGVRRDTTQDRYLAATYPGAVVRRYGDPTELYLDLALGRLDAALVDVLAARTQFLDTELGADFDLAGPTLDDPAWFGEGLGVAVRKGDAELRDALNRALRALRADGTLDALRADHFNLPAGAGGG